MRPRAASLLILGTSPLDSRVSELEGSMPGPTDLRGALAAGFGAVGAGNWL